MAAGAATAVAGLINAVAGGGTLVSFPTLVAIGVPAVGANVTNTVALVPGYLAGSWAQRDELKPEVARARVPAVVAGAGGLAGSILLILIPGHAFRSAVPFLILLSCGLLAFQDRLRRLVSAPGPAGGPPGPAAESGPAGESGQAGESGPAVESGHDGESGQAGETEPAEAAGRRWSAPLLVALFASAAYGGFFGAGLGIMLLAVLGLFTTDPLQRLNALKQALSFIINMVAAALFVFSGHVQWQLVPVMAVASLAGGFAGGRLVSRIDAIWLRRAVVTAGVAVAVSFWVG